jgi:hypothetical protein
VKGLGFPVLAIVIAIVVLGCGVTWLYFYVPQAPETCSPFKQEVLAYGFKGDAIVFGMFGAVAAAVLYAFMLRHQIFFPRADAVRFVTAAGVCALAALMLASADWLAGPTCLRTAVSSETASAENLALIRSFSGHFVGNVWLAIGLDQLFLALGSVGVVRLYREMSLRFL